jgi:putative oxidoreductase
MSQATRTTLARWGLVPLRVAIGIVFMTHGGQKLFVMGFAGTAGMFAHMGVPLPAVSAAVVTIVEFFGGLAILLGFFARWAGLLLACDMTVAILKVRLAAGFYFLSPRGFELEWTLLGGALTIALLGSGELSLDRLLKRGDTGAVSAT